MNCHLKNRLELFRYPLTAAALFLAIVITQSARASTFAYTGTMNSRHAIHSATLLPNGKVLVAGGVTWNGGFPTISTCELFNPTNGTWSLTGSMNYGRRNHTETLLPNGQVLVTGNFLSQGSNQALPDSAELYNPVTGTWSVTGSMNIGRGMHTATLLNSGKVLVIGGAGTNATTELYDPASGTWSYTGTMNTARGMWPTATLLPDGKVLVAGGQDASGNLNSAEIYDPFTGAWTTTGPMNVERNRHSAILLPNGKVLVAGGDFSLHLESAELYDPATGLWTPTGPMNVGRHHHTATLLCDGSVLVTGGYGDTAYLSSAELYDPATGAWKPTGSLNQARGGVRYHTATLLPNGKVLIAGGSQSAVLTSAELYEGGGCVTVSNWTFLDIGFIAGGQNGVQRVYNDPDSVAASPWSFQSPCKTSLRMAFEHDANCSTPYNQYTQTGLAVTTINICEPMRMYITWSGLGERELPNFELMSIYVNPTNQITAFSADTQTATFAEYSSYGFHGSAHAPGGNYQCTPDPVTGLVVAPVVSSPAPPQYVDLPPGTHTILIQATTNDEFYHIGAYYQFDLGFEPLRKTLAQRIAAGSTHNLVAKFDGTVWAWGSNGYGKLGDGTTTQRLTPVPAIGISNVVAVSGGVNHSMALKSDGTVWTWGQSLYGQLGHGSTTGSVVPVQVPGLSGVRDIVAAAYNSYALLSNGTVKAWGINGSGQIGDGTQYTRLSPVLVANLTNAVAIASDGHFCLALKSDGTVWGWGANWDGQLGDGTTTSRSTPVQAVGVSNVWQIAAQNRASHALKFDGTVWSWGGNLNGQLGDGTGTSSMIPVQTSITEVVAINAASNNGYAIRSDGSGWAWGYNYYGQVGDGSTTTALSPVPVSGFSDCLGLSGGLAHTLGLKSDFSIHAWGYNTSGQVGDGTTVNRMLPVDIGLGL